MQIKHLGIVVKEFEDIEKSLFDEGYRLWGEAIIEFEDIVGEIRVYVRDYSIRLEVIKESEFTKRVYGGIKKHICINEKVPGKIICEFKEGVTFKLFLGILFEESIE